VSVVETLTLASEELSVEVAARRGGRITRLTDRRSGREWLIGPHGTGARAALDVTYTETDHYGWDEMLPTVDPCAYPDEPYSGTPLPDHGELWSASWEVLTQSATTVHQRVVGRRLDFTFQRLLEVHGPVLRCSYRCETPVDTVMLWALHPQFRAVQGTRLCLSPEPETVLEGDLDHLRPRPWTGVLEVDRDVAEGGDLMLYADPDRAVTGASLTDPSGDALTMTWDQGACPYLAIWADRGRYSSGRVIAIEPCNGFADDLARAVAAGRATTFAAGVARTWWVEIALRSGRDESR